MNKLNTIICLQGKLSLQSPLLIGNGINDITDNDILKDNTGKPFIPGTSIAGAIRNYLETSIKDEKIKKDLNIMFGNSEDDSNQSIIYFHDCKIDTIGDIRIRDGIEVDAFTKTTKDSAKYDYEVLEISNNFEFNVEMIIRDKFKDKMENLENIFKLIIESLKNGKILIGGKKTRGLGKVKLINIAAMKFDITNEKSLKEYLEFSWNDIKKFRTSENKERKNKNNIKALKCGEEFLKLSSNIELNNYNIEIKVPLKLKDTLFIRNYLLPNTDVDAEQLNFENRFIIPGTSLAGAFRSRIYTLLYDLGTDEKKINKIINKLFGCNEDDGQVSKVIFSEARDLNESKFALIRRTKIDRFTGGACDKGLYDARVAVGGDVELCITLKNGKDYEIALILITLYDLITGLLAVGGETSVGRGLLIQNNDFKLDKKHIKINEKSLNDEIEKKYFRALKDELLK